MSALPAASTPTGNPRSKSYSVLAAPYEMFSIASVTGSHNHAILKQRRDRQLLTPSPSAGTTSDHADGVATVLTVAKSGLCACGSKDGGSDIATSSAAERSCKARVLWAVWPA